jgi:hypothetical protein
MDAQGFANNMITNRSGGGGGRGGRRPLLRRFFNTNNYAVEGGIPARNHYDDDNNSKDPTKSSGTVSRDSAIKSKIGQEPFDGSSNRFMTTNGVLGGGRGNSIRNLNSMASEMGGIYNCNYSNNYNNNNIDNGINPNRNYHNDNDDDDCKTGPRRKFFENDATVLLEPDEVLGSIPLLTSQRIFASSNTKYNRLRDRDSFTTKASRSTQRRPENHNVSGGDMFFPPNLRTNSYVSDDIERRILRHLKKEKREKNGSDIEDGSDPIKLLMQPNNHLRKCVENLPVVSFDCPVESVLLHLDARNRVEYGFLVSIVIDGVSLPTTSR